MIPALIILALWVALLAPGVLRWLREHQPTTSISSFHRQLRLLEHSGPKIVEPAYRLGGVDEAVTVRAPRPSLTKVPRLVLLSSGPTNKESTMPYDDRYGDRYDGVEEWDAQPWEREEPARDVATRSSRTVRSPSYDDYDDYIDYDESTQMAVLTPERARARRTRILAGLGAAIAGSFILGLLPGLTILWAVTLLSVIALVGYLGLMFYASNSGLYGHDTYATTTPIARAVMPTFSDYDARYVDDDDGWDSGRIAAAR